MRPGPALSFPKARRSGVAEVSRQSSSFLYSYLLIIVLGICVAAVNSLLCRAPPYTGSPCECGCQVRVLAPKINAAVASGF